MTQQLQNIIDTAWEQRAEFSPSNAPAELRDAVAHVLAGLDAGTLTHWEAQMAAPLGSAELVAQAQAAMVSSAPPPQWPSASLAAPNGAAWPWARPRPRSMPWSR